MIPIHNAKIPRNIPIPAINNAIAMMSTGVFYSAAFTHILLEVFGIKPEIAFGYSMGECSSMWYALGVWSSNEAREFQDSPIFKNRFAGDLELLAETWGISSEEAKERWISLVLLAPREKVEQLIQGEDKVYLTFVNTENEVVISGDKIIYILLNDLKSKSVSKLNGMNTFGFKYLS